MNRNSLPKIYFILLLCLFPFASQAQADTSFVQAAVAEALLSHKKAIGLHAHLYNGQEYYAPGKPYLEGHQFLIDRIFQEGNVKYDGAWFEAVPMLHDIVQDELIIMHTGSGHPHILDKKRVEAFEVHGRSFVYLQTDSANHSGMPAGFYNVLYDGEVKLLMRHKKTLHERTSTNGMEGEYKDASRFFLLRNATYYKVSNKQSVLLVLKDQKKQLNKFAAANNLRFKKNREDALMRIVQQYDKLQD
ncbi:hypothetical protein H9Q13_16520 [Pontibacter sp. JH31]|uniref:Uncharacterized protein n=1 Tax=Pontibacter aquaedesilientis TaxID=2766980 RepID=A0ABR7XKG8_9BACT|nr:hypothetical protein [Pontibacter aquaedesilientis]MBD1398780.1 hypothetical protein [Pontibacter aquaedesilientis]